MIKNGFFSSIARWSLILLTAILTACGAAPDVKKILEGEVPDDHFDLVAVFNTGETHTTSTNVTLNIGATNNPTEMYLTSDSTCATGGTWEPFANTKSITLTNLNAKTTQYIKVWDGTTESLCVEASITHDSIAPTLSIVSPIAAQYVNLSNQANFQIGGLCSESGTIQISGSISTTATCSNGSWNKSVNFTSNAQGVLTVSAAITDLAGHTSATQTVNFQKDAIAPTSPSIVINNNDVGTTLLGVTLTLAATDATQMYITNTAGCTSGGSYETYNTSKSWTLGTANAVNNVYVKFKDVAGNETSCVSDSIIHDNVVPTLTFTTPSNGTWVNLSNQNAFAIGGTCSANGQNVVISGDASATVTCSSGIWAAALNLSSELDGTDSIDIKVDHASASGLQATQAQRLFSKDAVLPAAPVVTTPASSPYTSYSSPLAITGTCENGASVSITGAETLNATCSGAGTFTTNLTQSADGSYNYTLKQTDAAGNVSTTSSFSWIVDLTSTPPPVITSPSPSPHFSSQNTVTISGTCVDGFTLDLSGDVLDTDVQTPSGQLSQTCSGGTFSYVIQKTTDDTYTFQITQTNFSSLTSAPAIVDWTRDTVSPSAPTISTPMTSPYTSGGNLAITGGCEDNATVYLSGDSTQNMVCLGSVYSFTVTKSTDATYNFTVSQTDRAGNVSSTVSQQWVRDSSTLPAPVITTPSTSPLANNSTSITLSGTCVTGYTVTLESGAIASEVTSPAGSLTQTCLSSSFSFVIAKSTDGTYNFSITQSDGWSTSPSDTQQWTRDTTPPNTTLSQTPANPNPRLTATFAYSSNEPGSTFQCSFDSGAWTSCTSPVTLSSLSNATHTYDVRAIDAVGNVDPTPASYTWVQQAYNAVALYHLTNGAQTVDSSNYTSTFNNPLTNVGTASTTGKFDTGRTFTATSSHRMYAADSDSFDATDSQMTIEMWVRHSSLPANGEYQVYAAKSSTTAGDIGWEFGVKRQGGGSNYRLYFASSVNGGANRVEVVSSSNCADLADTSNFYHVAVTWNKGSIAFYCDGVANGTGTNGTIGSAVIHNSTAQLQLGAPIITGGAYKYFNGRMDEVRISQTVRYTTTFTPSTSAFTPD